MNARLSFNSFVRSTTVLLTVSIALLCGHGADHQVAEAATFTVNSTNDVDDGTCNGAHCSLREAINAANANGTGSDTIAFSIGSGLQTIAPTSALPTITGAIDLDGSTQPGFTANPIIEIDGTSAGATNGLNISAPGGLSVIVDSVIVNRFNGAGIRVIRSSGASALNLVISNTWIGVNSAGTGDAGNTNDGVDVSTGGFASIFSTTGRNVISGNGSDGVELGAASLGAEFSATNIGTNRAGTAAIPNDADGVRALALVGFADDDPPDHSVISGNVGSGLELSTDNADGSFINNVYIGTDFAGTGALGNGATGVIVSGGASDIDFGNLAPVLIANNGGHGIQVSGATTDGVTLHANSIHSNPFDGISLVSGGNSGIAAPTISGSLPPTGTACSSCFVEIFSDAATEGRTYHGTVQATAGGAWGFYGPVGGANITATATDGSGNTSMFSSTLARPACSGATCLEGLWNLNFITTGPAPDHYCTTYVNQSGATTQWGHFSCTDGLTPDWTGTLNQSTNATTVSAFYPSGMALSASGTFAEDGNSASGTWGCTALCAESGTFSGVRVGDPIASIPAGGGSDTIGSSAPSATITVPVDPGSPAVTVSAVPIVVIPSGGLPLRTAYDFSPDGQSWSPPVTISVTYVASTDLPAAPYNDCSALAMYVLDEATNTWSWDGSVSCSGSTLTSSLDSFSVRGFFANVDTDGDGVDDGYDDCPQTVDGDSEATDLIAYGAAFGYDLTWPNGDNVLLIPCNPDNDDDNDGLTDTQEISGSACGSFGPTNPLDRDSDGDNYLDGAECSIGKNPNSMLLADRPTQVQCGATTDADNDGMLAFREFCFYNTNPAVANTDGDIRPPGTSGAGKQMNDGCEAASINKDYGIVNVIDLQQIALAATGSSYLPGNPKQVDFDYTKDGVINVIDLQQVAARTSDTNCQ